VDGVGGGVTAAVESPLHPATIRKTASVDKTTREYFTLELL
jgi:hypothetical protein